jgi:hypothetical protein
MKCKNCLLVEMAVDRIDGDIVYFKCRRCGEEIQKTVEEIRNETEESN